MFRRKSALRDPVSFTLDDDEVIAERGEPLAVALLASGYGTLARSPKLHRPRGPSCLRGGCDGCLARLDDVPNVMTCLAPARGGERVETQNFVGTRKSDLLRITDWFFPHGIDHHHLLVGVPGLSDAMQGFARKLAGLGRLPLAVEPERPAERREVDVLVVGGGLSGASIAGAVAAAGKSVCLVDDGPSADGSLASLDVLGPLAERVKRGLERASVLANATACGIYRGEVLVAAGGAAIVFKPRALVLSTGAHDGGLVAPGNDLPGVMSARAVCHLLARGLVPKGRVALCGDSFWAEKLARALGDEAVIRVDPEDVIAVRGTSHVRGLVVKNGARKRSIDASIVAVATRGAPSFELAMQAGASAAPEMAGYRVLVDDDGRAADGVWAAGECTGIAFDPAAIEADAAQVAASVVASLSPR